MSDSLTEMDLNIKDESIGNIVQHLAPEEGDYEAEVDFKKEEIINTLHYEFGIESEELKTVSEQYYEGYDGEKRLTYLELEVKDGVAKTTFGQDNIRLIFCVKGEFVNPGDTSKTLSVDSVIELFYYDVEGEFYYVKELLIYNEDERMWFDPELSELTPRLKELPESNPFIEEIKEVKEAQSRAQELFRLLGQNMQKKSDMRDICEEIGLDANNLDRIIEVRNNISTRIIDYLITRIAKNKNISDLDKRTYLGDLVIDSVKSESVKEEQFEIHRKLINDVLQRLCVYISLTDPELKMLGVEDENNLIRLVYQGLNKLEGVYALDIPLYDKVYEEFDSLRQKGRHDEIYLGRDGVYAFLGRRAVDIARRKKLGWKKRKELREKGELVEIHPKYVVYPRAFVSRLDPVIKRYYLEQEGVSSSENPIFFDTGFAGTIPEDIMCVLGYDSEKIDKRIKLLSSTKESRRVKAIPKGAREDIVRKIEHNVKTENSSDGLYYEEANQKVRRIARPRSAAEQFLFSMVRYGIVKHFYIRELSSDNQ